MNYLGRSDHHAVTENPESRGHLFSWNHSGSTLLKITGLVARTVFIVTFVAVTWWVSFPADLMSKDTTHVSAGDVAKFAIGIAMCIGMLVQLRRLPRGGEDGYKAWTFVGLLMAFVLVAFAIIKFASPS
jgi:hypothetical protein